MSATTFARSSAAPHKGITTPRTRVAPVDVMINDKQAELNQTLLVGCLCLNSFS